MPSWIGPWEIAIVVIIALLVFGPKKLPDLGSSLGKSITGFKKGLKETQEDVRAAIKEDVSAEAPTSAEAPVAASVKTPVTATTTAAAPPQNTEQS